jgi:hypothetical protein
MQTINANETAKLTKAMRAGKPFYIQDKDTKVLAYDPEYEREKRELFALLEEADQCTVTYTAEEFWSKVKAAEKKAFGKNV